MYMVVRSYSGPGASELFDGIAEHEDEVKELIGGVPGFVSYSALRDGDGGVTVTVCEAKAGADESTARAAAWAKENVDVEVSPPQISEGNTFLQF
jgi:hypothetical protein